MTMDSKQNPPELTAKTQGDNLTWEEEQLQDYAVDDVVPKAVAFVRQREEAAAQLKLANGKGLKVVPTGSGTKMTIGAPPQRVDLVLKLELMNRIVEHDHRNLTVTVEAGARIEAVQAMLREHFQFLPIDPPFADRATIGGILATNSSGPKRLLHGSSRDFVLGIRAALPDGTLIKAGGKTVKNVAGFDLHKLYIASLGTLGVIVEATFRVLPLPERSSTQLFLFRDLDTPCAFVSRLLQTSLSPTAVEILNPAAAARCKTFTGISKKALWGAAIACEGFAEAVERQCKEIGAMAEGAEVAIPLQGKEQDVFWRFITDHLPKEGRQDSRQNVRGKASLPVSQVGAFIADAERISQEAGDGAEIVAHGASGVVYFMCSEEDISPAKVTTLRKRANELGGWLTLECAPTAIKRQVSVWDSPPGGLEVMKRIRAYFDPKRTLNPGRFLV